MKRIILLVALALNFTPAFSAVVNVDLDEMIKIALEQNNDIKIKRLDLGAVQKDVKIANRLQNPELLSNVVIGNVALGNCSQAGVALPIEVMKRGLRKKIAQEKLNAKEIEIKQFEHNLKLQIMQAYFDVLYAKSVYLIQSERLKLFKSLVKITTDREKHSSYEIDNLKADIQYATQQIEVNRAHSEMLAKQFELNKILNTGNNEVMYDTKEASLFEEDWRFLKLRLPEYDVIEKTALEYSYVIRLSDKKVKQLESELQLVKNNRVPDISVAGGYA